MALEDFDRTRDDLEELAFTDESAPYEVDMSGIYRHKETGRFHLLTASGCSCWDGQYDENTFRSIDDIETFLLGDVGDYRYTPSLEGAKSLVNDARLALLTR